MESTVLSLGKSVLDGAVSYTKSAIAEEVALQLGVQSDQAFIKDELEMMQAFLMAAHEEQDHHKVLKTWVKQVRDMAYDVEDCLQDFAIHLKKPSWWRIHRTLRERHRIAKQMKELRTRVEDVSQRNMRYHLIKGSGSKTATKDERSSITGAAMFGIDEARRAAKQDKGKVDLVQLINKEDEDLRVIAVWGTNGDLGQTSIIRAAYESSDIKGKFRCRAWVRVMHPFNPIIFAQSLVKQFHAVVGVDVLLETEKTGQDLAQECKRYVNEESFLVVLNDLSTIEEWDQIKNLFQNTKKGSRIVVSTEQVEVASLCAGQESQVSELKQLSADQTIYAFYEKGSQDGIGSTKPESSSNAATTSTNKSTVPTGEILEDQSKGADGKKVVGKSLTRIRTMSGALEESQLVGREKEKSDIIKLISNQDGQKFQVISLWGMGGLGKTALAKDIYQSQELSGTFDKRAFVTVMRPFNRDKLLRSLVMQLDAEPSEKKGVVGLLGSTKKSLASMGLEALIKELAKFLGRHSCLIVLDDVSSTAEWDLISPSFPEMKNTTRIIVTTRQENIAKHCSEKQENIYKLGVLGYKDAQDLFTKKGSQDGIGSTKPESSSNAATTSTNKSTVPTGEILEDQSKCADGKKVVGKSLTRIKTMAAALEESQLFGREKEKSDIIKLISNQDGQQFQVISLWGMGGLGKTTLAKDIYQSQELSGTFDKRAFVTVMHPFNRDELLRSLVMQLDAEPSEKKGVVGLLGSTKKSLASMGLEVLIRKLAGFIERQRCLIVLDDVSSTAEWDLISPCFREMENTIRIIVTTREEDIAKHCSKKQENIYKLKVIEYKDAHDLFTKKVFKERVDLKGQYPELVEEAKLILKKCSGLPLAIVTIGGFLANQPKTAVEWRKLNEHISAELEMNPELETIRTVLVKSYDGLPYHLKTCFLYLSIFPEDYKVNRRRLVRRWIAEGYSREMRGKSAEEIADSYFMELISRSMILPSQQSIHSRKRIDSCQVHDLIREIGITKSMEENLVFRLEEGCSVNSQDTVRHLVVSSSWEGDQGEFESIVDMSRIRSLTVFGKWRPFLISDKMRLLRVLDLEGTKGLVDHHLKHIGKLLHLRYLSLRGCGSIFYLPDSVGNLGRLQTLDVRGTSVFKLPKTIIKLRKLQYIRAGGIGNDDAVFFEKLIGVEYLPKVLRNKLCYLTFCLPVFCVACCAPQLLTRIGATDVDDDIYRCDVCAAFCCALFPLVAMGHAESGVVVPRGIRKLKALHTLGIVDIARGEVVLQDIKRLTQLRKLGVTGVNKKNAQEFCSAIAALSRLESLLVQSEGEPGLSGCLDGMSSPPKNLQSLKLYGNLVKLPGWIQGLQNLVKLKLRSTRISEHHAAMQVLAKLPNLAILRLWNKSFQGEELRFNFRQKAFPSLMVLELDCLDDLKSVGFEGGATPKLEWLDFCGWREKTNTGLFSGLELLPSLKEFQLDNDRYKDDFVEDLRAQLAANPNGPVLKRY